MSQTRPHYLAIAHDNARWDGFEFRSGDVVISTPPKCGTTWMQMICSLLVFQEPVPPRPLTEISPWLEMSTKHRDEVFAVLDAQRHRRFIKSHTPLDGLPMDERVTYVCVGRDPRDVAMSWINHWANMDEDVFFAGRANVVGTDDLEALLALDPPPTSDTLEGRFWHWVDNPALPVNTASSLRMTLHHYDLMLRARERKNIVVFHYSDLKKDLEGEMRRLAQRLDISVPERSWPALVEAASFEQMRGRADQLAPNTNDKLWKDNSKFFHSGTGGGWRAFFDDAARRRYEARVAEFSSPPVAAWAHYGSQQPAAAAR